MTQHTRQRSRRTARSVRLVDRVDTGVDALAARTGRDRSAVVNELLDEGLRMRRIPGIVFGDSPSGRVARVAGTGLGVHEVVSAYRNVGNDWDRLREAFHWLSEHQLRAALAYAEAFPDEIDAQIRENEACTPERTWETYRFMRPRAVR